MDPRLRELKLWVEQTFNDLGLALSDQWQCEMVSGDASFRRYFRVLDRGRSWIAVDAPPEKEDSRPFVAVAQAWLPLGVAVPEIEAVDLEQGFMLLEDLGDVQYLGELNADSADQLYEMAFQQLVKIQSCRDLDGEALPPYDYAMLDREVLLFRDWFLKELLGLELSEAEERQLRDLFELLIGTALEQPQVCVHRDYHSRNLMLCDQERIGVIDFQDAVMGPVTYDLVSLLRDCYIAWPDERLEIWTASFVERIRHIDGMGDVPPEQFRRWFDLMGMQRHLKAVGIFARLKIRDGKAGYLPDIPRTFGYLLKVGAQYPQTQVTIDWLRARVVPQMYSSGLFDEAQLDHWLNGEEAKVSA